MRNSVQDVQNITEKNGTNLQNIPRHNMTKLLHHNSEKSSSIHVLQSQNVGNYNMTKLSYYNSEQSSSSI
jgi:hypothetical protein